MSEYKHAAFAKEIAKNFLGDIPEINGYGLVARDGDWFVMVNLRESIDENLLLPETICGGVPLRFQVVGQVFAQ